MNIHAWNQVAHVQPDEKRLASLDFYTGITPTTFYRAEYEAKTGKKFVFMTHNHI